MSNGVRPDSAITIQYKEQEGSPYNGWSATTNQTGIENVAGVVGLNYLSGTTPTGNALHSSLAVRADWVCLWRSDHKVK
jgi:hypothetical protein